MSVIGEESKVRNADRRLARVPHFLPENIPMRDHRIHMLLEHLSEGWSAGISVAALSAVANLSPRHLCAVFKRETGMALREYLQSLRMAKAANILCSTALSAKEVACAAGYSATSNFDREFKRAYGVRPSEYRNRVKEAAAPAGRHTRARTNAAAVGR